LDDLIDIGVVLGDCFLGLYNRLDNVGRPKGTLQFLWLFEGVEIVRLDFTKVFLQVLLLLTDLIIHRTENTVDVGLCDLPFTERFHLLRGRII
jgi:hypothetical protein